MGKALEALTDVASKEVKGTGKFVIPTLRMIRTKHKPAGGANGRKLHWKERRDNKLWRHAFFLTSSYGA